MNQQNDIYEKLKNILVSTFEIDAADISPESHLYEDLDIDSIDAVDLVVQLRELTDKKIKPEDFKSVRTVQDVVNAIEALIAAE